MIHHNYDTKNMLHQKTIFFGLMNNFIKRRLVLIIILFILSGFDIMFDLLELHLKFHLILLWISFLYCIQNSVLSFWLFTFATDKTGQKPALRAADTITRYVAGGFFVFQLVFILASTFFTNTDDANLVVLVFAVCGVNILLTMEIAMFLAPVMRLFAHIIRRPEFFFAIIGIIVLATELVYGNVPFIILFRDDVKR